MKRLLITFNCTEFEDEQSLIEMFKTMVSFIEGFQVTYEELGELKK